MAIEILSASEMRGRTHRPKKPIQIGGRCTYGKASRGKHACECLTHKRSTPLSPKSAARLRSKCG